MNNITKQNSNYLVKASFGGKQFSLYAKDLKDALDKREEFVKSIRGDVPYRFKTIGWNTTGEPGISIYKYKETRKNRKPNSRYVIRVTGGKYNGKLQMWTRSLRSFSSTEEAMLEARKVREQFLNNIRGEK